jgi:hypothetical protein
MKVFISWSGPRSRHVANALRSWLKLVIQNLDPWVSERDLAVGGRWGKGIDEALESTDYGILVLTPGHIDASWLMFEAGALSKSVDGSRVVPYCYGLTPLDIPQGPLNRFQGVTADESGTRKLLDGIATTMLARGERAPDVGELDAIFSSLWSSLKAQLDKTPTEVAAVPPPPNTDDVLREILEWVRTQKRTQEPTLLRRLAAAGWHMSDPHTRNAIDKKLRDALNKTERNLTWLCIQMFDHEESLIERGLAFENVYAHRTQSPAPLPDVILISYSQSGRALSSAVDANLATDLRDDASRMGLVARIIETIITDVGGPSAPPSDDVRPPNARE